MLTADDIEDLTCLTRAEIEAIADHESMDIVTAALRGEYLMHIHHGPQKVQTMICDDIREALHKGDLKHARALYDPLHEFLRDHADAARGVG